jgi:hypothetical protein
MRSTKYGLGLAIATACMALGAGPAAADTYSTRFEAPAFTSGSSPDGQDGWLGGTAYDSKINPNTTAQQALGLGAQSLRISNSKTSDGFGDQTYSAELGDEAGETAAVSNGLSGGVRRSKFDARMTFAAADPTAAPADDDVLTVAPDRGDGSRMANVRIVDHASGTMSVVVFDVADTPGNPATFPTTEINNLDRSVAHTLEINMDFQDGDSNDVVKVYVDGVLQHTGTSWEQYYRDDPEQGPGNKIPTIDQLLFAERNSPSANVTSNAGKGILIDDLRIQSGDDTGQQGIPGSQGNPGAPGTPGTAGAQGATGPQGTSGTFTFAGTTVNTKAVTLGTGSLKPNRKRQVKVSVSCPRSDGLCEGNLKLARGRTVLARGGFFVRGGRTSKVTLTIGRRAYRSLGKSSSANLSVFSRDLAGAASTFGKKVTLKK